MAREVRVVQIRLKSMLDVPLITLPFVGDVPPRKLLYGMLAAFIAYTTALGMPSIYHYIAMVVGFAAGFMIARDPKAVAWEKQLYYLVTGYGPRPSSSKTALRPRGKAVEEAVVTLSEASEPVKIYGVVTDPLTGSPVQTEVTLVVDGQVVGKTVSDVNGRYVAYVYLRPGTHVLELRAGDQVLVHRRVVVKIRPEHRP